MFYYLYRITNLVNGKIYVGVHKTSKLDDGYMGSGKVISSAIDKHGIENFTKDILEFFENREAMYAREAEIVTEEFLARDDVYNLRRGGNGGFDYINTHMSREFRQQHNKMASNSPACIEFRIKMREECKGLFSEDSLEKSLSTRRKNNSFGFCDELVRESAQRDSARVKRKETFSSIGHQQGEKNSQFGTCWISHELIGSRKIKIDLLPNFIDQGWVKGRWTLV